MHKVRVGVLRGGPSSEYDVSLKTGATVMRHLPDHYYTEDIVISRDGLWHKDGLEISPHHVLSHVDVVFNALHGHYGEDGKIQHLLETHHIPFTGSGSIASALGMNKALSKEVFVKEGIKTPQCFVLTHSPEEFDEEELLQLFRTFSPPVVVKPVSGGSSVGMSLVKIFSVFKDALTHAFSHSDKVMIEEYIPGIEATVGVVEKYRDKDLYALPPIEIRPHAGRSFYDYEAKYQGMSDKIVPGNFSHKDKQELEGLAQKVHEILGLRHYSRTDFIVSPRRGIYVLEVNTLPGFTDESSIPKALHAVGASMSHFLDHVVQLALGRK